MGGHQGWYRESDPLPDFFVERWLPVGSLLPRDDTWIFGAWVRFDCVKLLKGPGLPTG